VMVTDSQSVMDGWGEGELGGDGGGDGCTMSVMPLNSSLSGVVSRGGRNVGTIGTLASARIWDRISDIIALCRVE
jgi:N-acetylglucosamine kinase-like BadF-type ATPase